MRRHRFRLPTRPRPSRKRLPRKPDRELADSPLDAAVRALARRDLSTRQLDERLVRAGVSTAARREALETAERLGYLNDERFARGRAKALAERGLGDAAIAYDLEQAGVDESLVAPALGSLAPEPERAKCLASSLGGGFRAARALARKGFARESIESALPEVLG